MIHSVSPYIPSISILSQTSPKQTYLRDVRWVKQSDGRTTIRINANYLFVEVYESSSGQYTCSIKGEIVVMFKGEKERVWYVYRFQTSDEFVRPAEALSLLPTPLRILSTSKSLLVEWKPL
jgi:hypothetical protein